MNESSFSEHRNSNSYRRYKSTVNNSKYRPSSNSKFESWSIQKKEFAPRMKNISVVAPFTFMSPSSFTLKTATCKAQYFAKRKSYTIDNTQDVKLVVQVDLYKVS